MKTFNFIVSIGNLTYNVDVDAFNEDDALDLIQNEYPEQEG